MHESQTDWFYQFILFTQIPQIRIRANIFFTTHTNENHNRKYELDLKVTGITGFQWPMFISKSLIVFNLTQKQIVFTDLMIHYSIMITHIGYVINQYEIVLIFLHFKTHVIHVIIPDGHCNIDYSGIKWSKYIFITDSPNWQFTNSSPHTTWLVMKVSRANTKENFFVKKDVVETHYYAA